MCAISAQMPQPGFDELWATLGLIWVFVVSAESLPNFGPASTTFGRVPSNLVRVVPNFNANATVTPESLNSSQRPGRSAQSSQWC